MVTTVQQTRVSQTGVHELMKVKKNIYLNSKKLKIIVKSKHLSKINKISESSLQQHMTFPLKLLKREI